MREYRKAILWVGMLLHVMSLRRFLFQFGKYTTDSLTLIFLYKCSWSFMTKISATSPVFQQGDEIYCIGVTISTS